MPHGSRLDVLNRNRRGNNSTSLNLGLEPAVFPSGEDEVGPDKDVSGKQHAENELEEEDELLKSLSVDGGDKGRDGGSGGSTILWEIEPLPMMLDSGGDVTGVGRELITANAGLLLFLGLVSTLDLALVEAALDTDSEGIRDRLSDTDNLTNSNITKCGIGDVRWKSKKFLSDATDTRVFTVQTSNKGDGPTVKVCLVVEGTLREDGTLTRVEDIGDESSAIFLDETDFKVRSGYHVEEFGGARVIVRRGQSARRHFSDREGHTLAKEERKVC